MIDILIKNYNNEEYITQCLNSIIDQNIKYDYKIIIHDDGSTDNSVKLIKEFIAIHKTRVKIVLEVNSENKGPLFTTMKLYEKITNPYWTVLDGDDYWLPDFINSGLDILIKDLTLGTYSTNTKLLENGSMKDYYQPTLPKILTNSCSFFPHTSSCIFSKKHFSNGVLPLFYDAYNSNNRFIQNAWEGDTARNFLWLYSSKNYEDYSKFGGVYRITNRGIWTKLNTLEKDITNNAFKISSLEFCFKYKLDSFNNPYLKRWQKNLFEYVKKMNNDVSLVNNKLLKDTSYLLTNKFHNMVDNLLYIYYPSEIIGGYEALFTNIIKNLVRENYNIILIDSNNFLRNNYLQNCNNVIYLNVQDLPTNKLHIIDKATILLPLTMSGEIENKLIYNDTVRLLYHIGHPKSYEFLHHRLNTSKFTNTDKFMLGLLSRDNSLIISMDKICSHEINERFNITAPIVPVFVDSTINSRIKHFVGNEINIGFLGRLDSDKIFGLINLIDNLHQYATSKKKNIHIIGDGKTKHVINNDFYKKERINIIYTGILIDEDKNNYIIKNIDIMFTAGLACIEQPFNGIPSVMIPLSFNFFSINDSNFTYLFNMVDYNGGYYIDDIHKISQHKFTSFKNIMDDIYEKNMINELGNKCLNYVLENHTFEIFKTCFIEL